MREGTTRPRVTPPRSYDARWTMRSCAASASCFARRSPTILDRLPTILEEPEVARWWGPPPPEGVAEAWLERDADDGVFAIVLDGRVVGSIQYAEENDADYRHAGIDLFLTTDVRARASGRTHPDGRAVPLRRPWAPPADDRSGGRERAGDLCLPAGRIPADRHHAGVRRGPDGTLHDGLLMDLLADELR